jgi:hypothetical protein
MFARILPSLTFTGLRLTLVQRITRLTIALAHALLLVSTKLKAREIDTGERNGDLLISLATNELARGNEALEIVLDTSTHNPAEAVDVGFHLHSVLSSSAPFRPQQNICKSISSMSA